VFALVVSQRIYVTALPSWTKALCPTSKSEAWFVVV
jgi:hypothetical protein